MSRLFFTILVRPYTQHNKHPLLRHRLHRVPLTPSPSTQSTIDTDTVYTEYQQSAEAAVVAVLTGRQHWRASATRVKKSCSVLLYAPVCAAGQGNHGRSMCGSHCGVGLRGRARVAGPAWQGNHGQGVLAKGEAPGRQGQGNHGRQGNARNIDT